MSLIQFNYDPFNPCEFHRWKRLNNEHFKPPNKIVRTRVCINCKKKERIYSNLYPIIYNLDDIYDKFD
jgi:hypothetical protein